MYRVAHQVFDCIVKAEQYQRMLRTTTGQFYPLVRI
jgi:hypothetical protein